jgi:ribosomal protein S18 acetylase RimI-like enzyme
MNFRMTSLRFRTAGPDDTESVARLHADSWRRHYRGAFTDLYLDGDVVDDRRLAWSSRLTTRANSMTILAEGDTGLTGFVHTVFDDDDRWGSLIDNLHVVHSRQRTGVGTALLTYAANAVAERAVGTSIYLWVLSQNVAAQRFYRALGGTCVEKSTASPPGGVPTRLNGSPGKLRITWPDPATLLRGSARAAPLMSASRWIQAEC